MPQSSIDRPEPSHVEEIDALHALESDDYLKVRAALAKIDPKALLDQIDKPKRPKWQTVILDDWVSVKIPQNVFRDGMHGVVNGTIYTSNTTLLQR